MLAITRMGSVAIGILVGLVLAVILLKAANQNHKMKTEYDERQKIIRGKAYQIAWYVMVIYEVLMMVLHIGEISLPVSEYVLHFGGVLVSAIVLAVYCIWKDVYWGLNSNRRRYSIIFLATGLLNAIPVYFSAKEGTLFANGETGPQLVNLMVLIMLVVLGITLIAKDAADRNAGREG